MLVCVVMTCLFFAALLSPAGRGLISLLSCVLCHFSKCVLVHIRIKGEVGAVKLVFALQYIFTDRSKAVLLLWIIGCYAFVRDSCFAL